MRHGLNKVAGIFRNKGLTGVAPGQAIQYFSGMTPKRKPIFQRRLVKDYRRRINKIPFTPEHKAFIEGLIKVLKEKNYTDQPSFFREVKKAVTKESKGMKKKPVVAKHSITRMANLLGKHGIWI